MDQLNWVVYELLFEQELAKRRLEAAGLRTGQPKQPRRNSAIREGIASLLVRAGLLLDPGAGRRLGAPRVPAVASEARPHA